MLKIKLSRISFIWRKKAKKRLKRKTYQSLVKCKNFRYLAYVLEVDRHSRCLCIPMGCFDGLHISAEWNKYKGFKVIIENRELLYSNNHRNLIEMSREEKLYFKCSIEILSPREKIFVFKLVHLSSRRMICGFCVFFFVLAMTQLLFT